MKEFFTRVLASKKMPTVLAIFCILSFFVFNYFNMNYIYEVPHGDIYQYINDARSYSYYSFPTLLQVHPLFPILMALVIPFFSNFEYPFFVAAKMISITSVSVTLYIIFLILKEKTNGWFSLFITILFFFHPFTLMVALNITNVSLFTLFVVIALYYLDKNKWLFAFSMVLAYFVRIEAFLLTFVYLYSFRKEIYQTIQDKEQKKSLSLILPIFYSGVVFVFWYLFQTYHNLNYGHSYGNYYVQEIFSRGLNIDNFAFLYGLIGVPFFPELFISHMHNSGSLVLTIVLSAISLWLLFLICVSKRVNVYGLFVFLYAFLHSFFPAIEYRYFYPISYLFLISVSILVYDLIQTGSVRKKSIVLLCCSFVVMCYLFFSISQFVSRYSVFNAPESDLDIDVSRWIRNSKDIHYTHIISDEIHPYYALIPESRMMHQDYHTTTKLTFDELKSGKIGLELDTRKLFFVDLSFFRNSCEEFNCILDKLSINGEDILVITNFYSSDPDEFWIKEKGSGLLVDLIQSNCLISLEEFKVGWFYRRLNKIDTNCWNEHTINSDVNP